MTEEQELLADVNGDGKITVLDALEVSRFTAQFSVSTKVGQPFVQDK